jgi:hypothetical protein
LGKRIDHIYRIGSISNINLLRSIIDKCLEINPSSDFFLRASRIDFERFDALCSSNFILFLSHSYNIKHDTEFYGSPEEILMQVYESNDFKFTNHIIHCFLLFFMENMDLLNKIKDTYGIGKFIGEGATSRVFECMDSKYIFKISKDDTIDRSGVESFTNNRIAVGRFSVAGGYFDTIYWIVEQRLSLKGDQFPSPKISDEMRDAKYTNRAGEQEDLGYYSDRYITYRARNGMSIDMSISSFKSLRGIFLSSIHITSKLMLAGMKPDALDIMSRFNVEDIFDKDILPDLGDSVYGKIFKELNLAFTKQDASGYNTLIRALNISRYDEKSKNVLLSILSSELEEFISWVFVSGGLADDWLPKYIHSMCRLFAEGHTDLHTENFGFENGYIKFFDTSYGKIEKKRV